MALYMALLVVVLIEFISPTNSICLKINGTIWGVTTSFLTLTLSLWLIDLVYQTAKQRGVLLFKHLSIIRYFS
ncbi:MAG: hypothetical protein AAFQ37_06510, partial [Bacteroidota bacterium]